jgi:hypothetical protein
MYAHVSEDIEMNLKNRNCGVRINTPAVPVCAVAAVCDSGI